MRNVWWTILGILALLAVFYAGKLSTRSDNAMVRDTITIYDTIRYIAPQVTARSNARFELHQLPRVSVLAPLAVTNIRDTVTIVDTVQVYVPIDRVVYSTDQYYAIVEGYQAKLVQLDIYNATKVVRETVTKRKHWGVSFGAQGGYGITPKGMQPYVGVGVTVGYNF